MSGKTRVVDCGKAYPDEGVVGEVTEVSQLAAGGRDLLECNTRGGGSTESSLKMLQGLAQTHDYGRATSVANVRDDSVWTYACAPKRDGSSMHSTWLLRSCIL